LKTTETEKRAAVERLIAECRQFPGLDTRDVLEAIDDPQFQKARATNDWRNAVDETVMEVWTDLPVEARLVGYLHGSLAALFD